MGTGRGRRGPITHSYDEEAGSQRGSQLRNYMKQVTLPLKKKKKKSAMKLQQGDQTSSF